LITIIVQLTVHLTGHSSVKFLTLELNTPLDQGHLSADHSDNDLLPSVSTLRTTAG
ncbi:Non-specific lipid-transfer protein, partial [Trichinella spiralis]